MNSKPLAVKPAVPTITRVRGIAAMVIGAAIAIGMTAALLSETRGFLNPGVQMGEGTFTGTIQQGQLAVALFALVAFLGAVAFIGGWQLFMKGKVSKTFVVVFGIVLFMTVVAAYTLSDLLR